MATREMAILLVMPPWYHKKPANSDLRLADLLPSAYPAGRLFTEERDREMFKPYATALVSGAAILGTTVAHAAYPCQTIRIVTPFGPGQTFAVSEAVRDHLQTLLQRTVIVESQPGAGGAIGTNAVVRAAADGCTVLFGASSSLILPFTAQKPYDALKDLRPVAFTIEAAPPVLVAQGAFSGSFADIVAKAKERPDAITIGTNNRTLAHLAMLQLFSLAGVKVRHIPFNSESSVVNQLLGGHIDFAVVLAPTALGNIRSGKLRALVQITSVRNAFIPDIPSAGELGIRADFRVYNSIFVPAKTPDAIVETLVRAIEDAKRQPSFIEQMARQASVPVSGGPAEVEAWLRKTTATWTEIIDRHGIERN